MTPRPYVVGLTGGIGSGKTAVADGLGRLGAALVDTDLIAHTLTAPGGAAMAEIETAFGPAVIAADGSLDRAAMRALAFSDPAARGRLEAILHPLIRSESARQCAAAQAPYVVLVVPLLVESGNWRERCDRLCVVDCPESLQIERVRARSALPEAQIRAIMAAQASRAERLAVADDVIDNSGPLAELTPRIEALHRRYLALAKR
ncbi:dephospho-CoA kinase [Thauera sp. CAU 1555]|uniref:Dephospho-CoA kinase n=1 Tax=Thauera sedimentorum TaxID=2767595 RepID=A0ABR9BDI2_9RHOO|nr:dephospho-CoA kinase [Thauera sedimentorum]MBD8504421.1 dephospho-CoA kinase [Thauera sedimentorum]